MPIAVLELIIVTAKIFSAERERYYKNKSSKLMKEIQEVEDSEFYKKDMEAKGKAERALFLEVDELKKQFILEATS